jgi:hypothetical protein
MYARETSGACTLSGVDTSIGDVDVPSCAKGMGDTLSGYTIVSFSS